MRFISPNHISFSLHPCSWDEKGNCYFGKDNIRTGVYLSISIDNEKWAFHDKQFCARFYFGQDMLILFRQEVKMNHITMYGANEIHRECDLSQEIKDQVFLLPTTYPTNLSSIV